MERVKRTGRSELMKLTTNLQLKKPEMTDYVDVNNFNDNADVLDVFLWNLKQDKVEKIIGKGLSTNDFTTPLKEKLDGIATGANKYSHPLTHPPAIIEQDLNNRFISDLELAEIENTKLDLGEHLADYASPHQYNDEGEEIEYQGARYRLVIINREPFLEVVAI